MRRFIAFPLLKTQHTGLILRAMLCIDSESQRACCINCLRAVFLEPVCPLDCQSAMIADSVMIYLLLRIREDKLWDNARAN